jgi:hypothetical protein
MSAAARAPHHRALHLPAPLANPPLADPAAIAASALPRPPPQAGKQKGNTAIGRYLAETVAAVPRFGKDEFERMLSDQQNDCTLVLFLSKLIQAHLALADKLGTMQLPLL